MIHSSEWAYTRCSSSFKTSFTFSDWLAFTNRSLGEQVCDTAVLIVMLCSCWRLWLLNILLTAAWINCSCLMYRLRQRTESWRKHSLHSQRGCTDSWRRWDSSGASCWCNPRYRCLSGPAYHPYPQTTSLQKNTQDKLTRIWSHYCFDWCNSFLGSCEHSYRRSSFLYLQWQKSQNLATQGSGVDEEGPRIFSNQ